MIAVWIVLTLVGGVAAGKLSSRWYQSTAIPGKSAYEAGQRTLNELGAGVRPPNVVVFHSSRVDVTKSPAVRAAGSNTTVPVLELEAAAGGTTGPNNSRMYFPRVSLVGP